MATVNIASELLVPVLMRGAVTVPGIEPVAFEIHGNRHAGAVAGHGITYDVDETTYTRWITANPWLVPHLAIVSDQDIADMAAAASDPANHGYEVGLMPPTNIDVPHVSQTGAVLNCTMGNWSGEPTGYSYQWCIDGVNAGTDAASYTVQPGDVGHTATCVVTASNGNGSTTAPPSNGVAVV